MFLVHGNLSFRNISTSVLVDDCQQSPWLCSVWTGGIRSTESDFIWSKNGNRITFTPWSPGDPNDKEGNENCIEMFAATGVWNDRKCDHNTFFMCEKNLNRWKLDKEDTYNVIRIPFVLIEKLLDQIMAFYISLSTTNYKCRLCLFSDETAFNVLKVSITIQAKCFLKPRNWFYNAF